MPAKNILKILIFAIISRSRQTFLTAFSLVLGS